MRCPFAGWASLLLVGLALAPSVPAWGAEPRSVPPLSLDTGTEIPLWHSAGPGPALLWLPGESGLLPEERQLARTLGSRGLDVWLADLQGAYFLPAVESAMAQIPPADVAALIQAIDERTPGPLYLATTGRGAAVALRGVRVWQQAHPNARLGGLVLISPKLFVKTPEPGEEGRFLPVVTATNAPIVILQPAKSPWRWKLDRIVPALGRGGSDVYAWVLPGVRDRFYYRPDAVAEERAMAEQLPRLLHASLPLLAAVADRPRRPPPLAQPTPAPEPGKTERTLRPFRGDPRPPPLALPDLDGTVHRLSAYQGRVVLVNFWASWCPPCVHEMPSMERLRRRLQAQGARGSGAPGEAGGEFAILAVNMAEDRHTVETFLQEKVQVQFTILLDRDGAALRRWKVFAFPTSYVLDKRGRIRYALFGAVDWEDPDIVAKLRGLLRE